MPAGAYPVESPKLGGAPADPRLTNRLTGSVERVIDGDTFLLRAGDREQTVRVLGMNTPEVAGPHRDPQCFGREASERATSLLTGQTVTIAQDPTQDAQDQFDRLLAYVWLPDGRLYQEAMIREGYAREYTYDRDRPPLLRDRLRAAEREARAAGRGLWAPSTRGGNIDQPPKTRSAG